MLQQKSCLHNLEIPGGKGVIKKPLGMELPNRWGVQTKKTFRGRGMDIFILQKADQG